ncbi:hypothetical protein B0H11DRAFT_1962640 [Mycena galericulata]|nr:hypothetical protein B0H11DRAFT_1962640 [Mycena galericulata]
MSSVTLPSSSNYTHMASPPPRRSALKHARTPKRPAVEHTKLRFDMPTLETPLEEVPEGSRNRAISRALIESNHDDQSSSKSKSYGRHTSVSSVSSTTSTDSSSSSSSCGSRRSSPFSSSSTESDFEGSSRKSKNPLRAVSRVCVSVAVGTLSLFTDFTHALFPGPTPEEQLTIPPLPMMRDTPGRTRLPPAFSVPLPPGGKRTRFVCPARVSAHPLWPDFESTLVPDM